ncbi:MAG: hypothetical protein QOI08_1642, partial [Actinomycetota bacterium]|nr:hypothetical protein [Actinomycetota bacterium]
DVAAGGRVISDIVERIAAPNQ